MADKIEIIPSDSITLIKGITIIIPYHNSQSDKVNVWIRGLNRPVEVVFW